MLNVVVDFVMKVIINVNYIHVKKKMNHVLVDYVAMS